jgi:hypothetical protein
MLEIKLLDEEPHERSGQTVELHGSGRVWRIGRLLAWIAD